MVRKKTGTLSKREPLSFAGIIPLQKQPFKEQTLEIRRHNTLKAFLQNRTRTEAESWHEAIAASNAYLDTLTADILAISLQEDPDSDELDRQERLVRSQHSISGLFAVSLAQAVEKRAALLSELVAHTGAAVVTGLLAAEKCYQPEARIAVAELTAKLGNGEAVVELLRQATQHKDTTIQKEAIRHLGAMRNPELIPVFEEVLGNIGNAPEVAYRAIVALEQSMRSVPDPASIVPGLQLGLRNNSAQVRMHAAKLLGSIQAGERYPRSHQIARRSKQLCQKYSHRCPQSYRGTRHCATT